MIDKSKLLSILVAAFLTVSPEMALGGLHD